MRDYGKVAPSFWTGDTGKILRNSGRDTQVLALYLMTCGNASMTGLYYLPMPIICHEIGLTLQGASKGLRSLFEANFAAYDEVSEVIFVREMAKFQIGAILSPKDNRHKAVIKNIEMHRKSPLYLEFHARYGVAYQLPKPSIYEAPSKPLRSGVELNGVEQEQEQEQNSLAAKKPRKRNELFDTIALVTGLDGSVKESGSLIGAVSASLSKAEPPYTPEDVQEFSKRFWEFCPYASKDPQRQRPTPKEVEKYIGLLRAAPSNRCQGLVTDQNWTAQP